MNIAGKPLRGILILAGTLLAAMPMTGEAQVVYTYTGNPFTTFDQTSGYTDTNPFTASDAITGSFTVDSALSPNQTYIFKSEFNPPTLPAGFTFSFSNGYASVDSLLNSGANFQVITDSTGNIADWYINIFAYPSPGSHDVIATATCDATTNTLCGSNVYNYYDMAVDYQSSGDYARARIRADRGTWTVSDVSAVPLPASGVLMLSGLLAIATSRPGRKRRR
jgi:hypothetical protein